MAKVAVVYLARPESGAQHIGAFARSYRAFAAGMDHALLVCIKSKRPDVDGMVQAAFAGLDHEVVRVDDDIGFDLHAFAHAARMLAEETVCFCNTYTRIQAQDWLAKLYRGRERFALVGASGSFQSLRSGDEIGARAVWLFTYPVAFDSEFTRRYVWMLDAESALKRPLHSRMARLRRVLGDAVKRRPSVASMIRRAEREGWSEAETKRDRWVMETFPPFPNPHVRTNVFMLDRATFLAAATGLGSTKQACYAFESGWSGLSRRVLEAGGQLGIVGRNGESYDVPNWPRSGCFRFGSQPNLLAADNQTDAYLSLDPLGRQVLEYMTWGAEAADPPPDGFLGVTFRSASPC